MDDLEQNLFSFVDEENKKKKEKERAAIASKDQEPFSFSWIAILVRGIVGTCISIFVYTQAARFENENSMGQFLVLSEAHVESVRHDLQVFENELKTLSYYIQKDAEFSNAIFPKIYKEHIHALPFTDSLLFLKEPIQLNQMSPHEIAALKRAQEEKIPRAVLQQIPGKTESKLIVFFPLVQKDRTAGFIRGNIDLLTLLRSNLIPDKANAMNVAVYRKGKEKTTLVAVYDAENTQTFTPPDTYEDLPLSRFQKEFSIKYLGEDFFLVYKATESFTALSWQPLIASSIGVLITTFIVVTAWILMEVEKRQFSHILHEEHALDMEGTRGQLEFAKDRLVAQEQLASLGGLTAGIAHEIKNPLNFINNFSLLSLELMNTVEPVIEKIKASVDFEVRKELEEALETLKENIHTIYEQGKKADNTIQRMLAHSRGQSGEWSTQEIHNIIEEYLNFSYHGMRAKSPNFRVKIKKSFAPSIKTATVVVNDISRVLLNLFNNAMQAVEEKRMKCERQGISYIPEVSVTTQDIGSFIRIRIWDNGTGIKEENKSKIFTPFFTTKPAGIGTGLGLSLSYNIVTREHGGSLTFDSKENEYTEFIITIPKHNQAET